MRTDGRVNHQLGSALVALQFGLIGLLAWTAWPTVLSRQVGAGAWGLLAASLLLAAWALASNKPGNFNIHPAPRTGARLVQQGPYRWVRHPMYTAVMAAGGASAWASASAWAWVAGAALLALVAVLVVKARLEERWMQQVHPGYAAYRQGTSRFLPWVF